MSVDAPYLPALPKGWREIQIKFRYWRQLGKMLQNDAKTAEDREIGFLRTLNVHWRGVDLGDLSQMWMHPAEYDIYGIRKGDLVVCEGGEVGRAAIVPELPEPIIAQNHIHRLRPQGDDDPRFLRYVLWHIRASNWFSVLCNKATIQTLPGDTLGAIKVPIPPPQQQRRIADWLECKLTEIDKIIYQTKQLIIKVEQQRKVCLVNLITRGTLTASPRRSSGIDWIGEIPTHWNLGRSGLFANWGSGDFISSDDYETDVAPHAQVPVIGGNGIMGYTNKGNSSGETVIIGRVGQYCGNVRHHRGNAFITDNALRLRFHHNLDLRYLAFALEAADPNRGSMQSAQPLITGTKIRNIIIPIPPLAEQGTIADIIENSFSTAIGRTALLKKQTRQLSAFRNSLVTAAVTGNILA